jgi:hypothetical protein
MHSADAIDGAYCCGLRYPPHSVATFPSLTTIASAHSGESFAISSRMRFCHPSRQGWLSGRTPAELLSGPGGERCNAARRV